MRALVTSSAPILGDLVESDTVEELRSLLLAKEQEAATLQWNLDAALEEVEALRDSPGGVRRPLPPARSPAFLRPRTNPSWVK